MELRKTLNDYAEKISNSIYTNTKNLTAIVAAGVMASSCMTPNTPEQHLIEKQKETYSTEVVEKAEIPKSHNVWGLGEGDSKQIIYVEEMPTGEKGFFRLEEAKERHYPRRGVIYSTGEEINGKPSVYVWDGEKREKGIKINGEIKAKQDIKIKRKGENSYTGKIFRGGLEPEPPIEQIPGLGEGYLVLGKGNHILERILAVPREGAYFDIDENNNIRINSDGDMYILTEKTISSLEKEAKNIATLKEGAEEAFKEQNWELAREKYKELNDAMEAVNEDRDRNIYDLNEIKDKLVEARVKSSKKLTEIKEKENKLIETEKASKKQEKKQEKPMYKTDENFRNEELHNPEKRTKKFIEDTDPKGQSEKPNVSEKAPTEAEQKMIEFLLGLDATVGLEEDFE